MRRIDGGEEAKKGVEGWQANRKGENRKENSKVEKKGTSSVRLDLFPPQGLRGMAGTGKSRITKGEKPERQRERERERPKKGNEMAKKGGGNYEVKEESGEKEGCLEGLHFFFFRPFNDHPPVVLPTGSEQPARGGVRAGVDYEDVALFSDEKKYVALIKSDADGERNYGPTRRAGFIRGLAFSPSNLFFAYFCSASPFPCTVQPRLFPISRLACHDFGKFVTRLFSNGGDRGGLSQPWLPS